MAGSSKRKIAAAVVLAGIVGAGCSAQPGAAAVVDGERITEENLDATITDFQDVTGEPAEPAAMLGTLVVVPTLLDVGAEHGIAVSEQQATELLDAQAEQTGGEASDPYADGAIQLAQMTLVQQEITELPDGQDVLEKAMGRIDEADIKVSPRYGEFQENGEVTPIDYPWLEMPEQGDEALPQPTP